MKKTLLALAVATTVISSFATASDLKLKPILDPRDKAGYEKLEELSGNTEAVQELHDIMEGANEYKDADDATKSSAMRTLLNDTLSGLETGKEKAAAFVALNNITVSQKYDSVLDQLVNSWALATDKQKEKFNSWNGLSGNNKRAYIAENAHSTDLYFSEEVPIVCGFEITKSSGSILFNSEIIGTEGEKATQVVVYSNAPSTTGAFKIDVLDTNLPQPRLVSFDLAGQDIKSGETKNLEGGLKGNAADIIAKYDASMTEINAGNAYIAATIEYSCGASIR